MATFLYQLNASLRPSDVGVSDSTAHAGLSTRNGGHVLSASKLEGTGYSMRMRSRFIEGVAILELSGQFDVQEKSRVDTWLEQAASVVPAKVVINLGGVHFLDTEALGSLIRGLKHCRQGGGDLRLCNLSQQVQTVFELTGLNLALHVFDQEEEAVQMPWRSRVAVCQWGSESNEGKGNTPDTP